MLDVQVQVPPTRKLSLRDFSGGFTDWKCGCPPNFFTVLDNFDIIDNKSICERFGSRIFDINNPRVPNQTRIQRLDCLKGNILYFNGKNITAKVNGTLTNINGTNTDEFMPNAVERTCSDSAFWQDHIYTVDDSFSLPTKIFCDEQGVLTGVTAGLPPFLNPPNVVSNTDEGATYTYAFVRCYEYNAQDTTYIDFSDVTYVQITDGPDFDNLGEAVDITGIDVLTSSPGTNYDESNVTIKVYRTTDGGNTFYEIGTLANGTTVFTDGQPDSAITNNPVIFNQDSSITYDPAPPSKYIEIVNDVAWYAHTQIGGVVYKNRLYQSLPSDPDTVPRDFFLEFQGEINGLSSYDVYPIVSVITGEGECTLYRVEGVLDDQGRNILQARVIAETVASINNNSFVKGKRGLYFFGTDGVYRTDGVRAEKLSQKWDETYCRITESDIQKKNVYGAFDKFRSRVYWGVTSRNGFLHNNEILVFKEDSNSFSWYKNDNCLSATSLIVKEKEELIRTEENGFIFVHEENQFSDPLVNVDVDFREWELKRIPWRIRSIEIDAGDCDTDKWFTKIHVMGKPGTNTTFAINSFDNGCNQPKRLKEVEYNHSGGWCTEEEGWCTDPNGWCVGEDCYMYQTRRFKCGKLRSKTKCIELMNTERELECSINSDPNTYINVDSLTGEITRVNGEPFDLKNIGNVFTINGVEYTATAHEDGALVIDLSTNPLVSGNYPYVSRGYRLNERFHLSCFTLLYCLASDNGGDYMAPEAKNG